MRTPLALVATVLLLGACTSGSPADDATTPASAASSTASAGSDGSNPSDSASTESAVVLSISGLSVVAGSTPPRAVDFGADRASVDAVLTSHFGPVTTTDLPECGQGPRTALQAGPLSALFDGESFLGWTLDDSSASPPVLTSEGIGIGSTLAEVEQAYEVSVSTDTIGPEFFTRDGQFGGLLDGDSPSSKVTLLYAGETCFFR